ncbi:MAG TPA: MarR family transcriptional regulator [Acidothermaceae bacterium]
MDAKTVTRLRTVIGRLARDLNATATNEGLTPTQASVLGLVSGRGPIGLAELNELEGLNPTLLSRVVSKLEELGLIERVPDPADLRTANVAVTTAGQSVHERIRDARADIISDCMTRLPKRSVSSLIAALPALEELSAQVRLTAAGKPNQTSPRLRVTSAAP